MLLRWGWWRLGVCRHSWRLCPNPLSHFRKLGRCVPASEVHGLDKNWILRAQWLLLPGEVDEVLRGKNQLGSFRVKLGNQLCGMFVRDHPSIDANLGVFNAILEHALGIAIGIQSCHLPPAIRSSPSVHPQHPLGLYTS